jgi:hypothetical protein
LKNVIYIAISIIFFSCGQGWSKEEKAIFIEACLATSKKTYPSVTQEEAEDYCDCMLLASMRKFRNGTEGDKEVVKMTEAEILKFIEPCQ